jgi:hypothetical protein
MLIALIWKFDFSPFMILVIAILNDGGFGLSNSTAAPESSASESSNPFTCLLKFRHNHDDIQGQSEAITTSG